MFAAGPPSPTVRAHHTGPTTLAPAWLSAPPPLALPPPVTSAHLTTPAHPTSLSSRASFSLKPAWIPRPSDQSSFVPHFPSEKSASHCTSPPCVLTGSLICSYGTPSSLTERHQHRPRCAAGVQSESAKSWASRGGHAQQSAPSHPPWGIVTAAPRPAGTAFPGWQ